MLKHLDLFSGIGGFALAARWTGKIDTVGFCEIDPFCRKVLAKHFPGVPIVRNIKFLAEHADSIGERIDLITGGFPCQPFSRTGKRMGKADDRFLWPSMLTVITAVKPAWIVAENVDGITDFVEFDQAVSSLESIGYEVRTLCIPACAVEASDIRSRVWIIANNAGLDGKPHDLLEAGTVWRTPQQSGGLFGGPMAEGWESARERLGREPGLARLVPRIPGAMDRLRSLGNAIDPRVAYPILKAISE